MFTAILCEKTTGCPGDCSHVGSPHSACTTFGYNALRCSASGEFLYFQTRSHARRPMRSQRTSVQYVTADEDNVVLHYKRIPVFCSDLDLVRCTEHGAEYKSDGGFYIQFLCAGWCSKKLTFGSYLEVPRNAVEKQWESLWCWCWCWC